MVILCDFVYGGHSFIMAREDKSDQYCFTCQDGIERPGADVMVRKHIGAQAQKFTIKSVMHWTFF